MKFTKEVNKAVSGLLWLFQFVNLNADLILDFLVTHHDAIPLKYRALAGLVIGGLQFMLAVKAHKFNPDGTPAHVAYRPEDEK